MKLDLTPPLWIKNLLMRRKPPMLSREAIELELKWMQDRVSGGRAGLSQVNDAWARGVIFALIWVLGDTPGAQPPQNGLRIIAGEAPPPEGFQA